MFSNSLIRNSFRSVFFSSRLNCTHSTKNFPRRTLSTSTRCIFGNTTRTLKSILSLNAKKSGLQKVILRQPIRSSVSSAISVGIPNHAKKIVGGWLVCCCGMVFGAVVLGGVTRLTESGLSMVDWKLLKDMTYPTNDEQWTEQFERYKNFPEYQYMVEQKGEMTLADFKYIYFMEWFHRMWGRGVGVVFALPALYFLKKGWISKAMKPRLAMYAALIGFQGFLGWYMVKSGLQEKTGPNDIPRVSQYRLAAHLGSAFALYTMFLWSALSHLRTKYSPSQISAKSLNKLNKFAHLAMVAVFFTALSGAFVAGLDAGLTYNSWPKMADRWIPSDLYVDLYSPKWKNIFENPTTVQFIHRNLGHTTAVTILGLWWVARKAPLPPPARLAVNLLTGMSLVQVTLGISTLLMYVPTSLAATHQSGSLVLLSLAIWFAHELKHIPK